MELHLTPDQEIRLAQLAARNGTAPERLATDAVLRLLEDDAHVRGAVAELPVVHLGAMGPLHRREIYDDAG